MLGSASWNDEPLYNNLPTNIEQYYNKYCNGNINDGSSRRLEDSLQHLYGGGAHVEDKVTCGRSSN
jgi:hypothetical protein